MAHVKRRPLQHVMEDDSVKIFHRALPKEWVAINSDHNFPSEMPVPEMGLGILQMMFSHPSFYCVVAEAGGTVIGSNCLDERSSIFGIGPITVDPAAQNAGTGRRLMRAVLDRAAGRGAPGVRLVQATFHNRSLSLYTKLGFDVRELLSVMHGAPMRKSIEGCSVRPAKDADAVACDQLCARVHVRSILRISQIVKTLLAHWDFGCVPVCR